MIGILKSLIIIYLGRVKWANAEGEWHSTPNVFLWESGAWALLVKLFKHFSVFYIWRHGERWMAGICNVGSFGTSVVGRCSMFVTLERLCLQKSDSYRTEEHSGQIVAFLLFTKTQSTAWMALKFAINKTRHNKLCLNPTDILCTKPQRLSCSEWAFLPRCVWPFLAWHTEEIRSFLFFNGVNYRCALGDAALAGLQNERGSNHHLFFCCHFPDITLESHSHYASTCFIS